MLWGCTGFDACPARAMGKPSELLRRVESRKTVLALRRQRQAGFPSGAVFSERHITWGCTGFDAVIGRFGLRVRALFPLINEQTKLNANDNVIAFPSRARLAA